MATPNMDLEVRAHAFEEFIARRIARLENYVHKFIGKFVVRAEFIKFLKTHLNYKRFTIANNAGSL